MDDRLSARSLSTALGLASIAALLAAPAFADYEPAGIVRDPLTEQDDARAACVEGSVLYMMSEETGTEQLNVYDVSDIAGASATFTQPVASLEAGAYDSGLLCAGDVLYAHGSEGIQIYDISNPLAPAPEGTLDPGEGTVYSLFFGNGDLVAVGAFGVAVYSTANPLAPTELDSLALHANERAYAGTVVNTTLYLGAFNFNSGTATIFAIDYANPGDLGVPEGTAVDDFIHHLRPATGGLLAVMDGSARLYSLSTPSSPAQISSLPLSGRSFAQRGDDYIVNGLVFRTAVDLRAGTVILEQVDSFVTSVVVSGVPHLGTAFGDYAFFMTSEGALVLGDYLFLDGFESEDLSGWDSNAGGS